jgi:hypothetical protein
MAQISQRRAAANHHRRLTERGISRYEVRGLEKDKELVRKLAKRLAADDADAARLRVEVLTQVSDGRSPLDMLIAATANERHFRDVVEFISAVGAGI